MSRLKRVSDWLNLLPSCLRLGSTDNRSVFFHSWHELCGQSVDREGFLLKLCEGKRVLHFGFVDAPFSEEAIKAGRLLHQKLKKTAAFLFGADIDTKSLQLYRDLTSDLENSIVDVQQKSEDFGALTREFDLILFPEVLEHLLHPADALANLRKICSLNKGAKLCITTPNAFSITGFFAALEGNEVVHPEHYYYFSPSTLKKLLNDTGLSLLELKLYSSANLLQSPGLTHHGLIAICQPREKLGA